MNEKPPVIYSTEKSSKEGLRLLMAFISKNMMIGYDLVSIVNVGADSIACVLKIERQQAPREPMAGLID